MKKALKVYALASQLILTLALLPVIGIFIGRHYDKDGNLPSILAGVGLFIGLIIDIIFVLQFLRFEERNDRRT